MPLCLDAHSLQEADRRSVVEAKARARAERLARMRDLALDRARLERFLADHAGVSRESLTASGHLPPDAPAKGTLAIGPAHRSPGDALLAHAKDVLFALLFGDESNGTRLDRVQQELLTMAVPPVRGRRPRLHAGVDRARGGRRVAGPESVSNDERAENMLFARIGRRRGDEPDPVAGRRRVAAQPRNCSANSPSMKIVRCISSGGAWGTARSMRSATPA